MAPPIQTLMKDIKAIVFQRDELVFQEAFKLIALLSLLTLQGSDSRVGNNFPILQKQTVSQKSSVIDWNVVGKMKLVKFSKYWV